MGYDNLISQTICTMVLSSCWNLGGWCNDHIACNGNRVMYSKSLEISSWLCTRTFPDCCFPPSIGGHSNVCVSAGDRILDQVIYWCHRFHMYWFLFDRWSSKLWHLDCRSWTPIRCYSGDKWTAILLGSPPSMIPNGPWLIWLIVDLLLSNLWGLTYNLDVQFMFCTTSQLGYLAQKDTGNERLKAKESTAAFAVLCSPGNSPPW